MPCLCLGDTSPANRNTLPLRGRTGAAAVDGGRPMISVDLRFVITTSVPRRQTGTHAPITATAATDIAKAH
ncbi:unnamed protein product [Lampetra planeri]